LPSLLLPLSTSPVLLTPLSTATGEQYKIIPYTSTNFFERTDPSFRPEWATDAGLDLVEHDYRLAHCSPASPGWRAHVLPGMLRILDEFDVDGLYNEMGYHRRADILGWGKYYHPAPKVAEDEVLAFVESETCDGAAADMLALIYSEVKRRGKLYKVHKEGVDRIRTDLKVYDYLWVGEAVHDICFTREQTKEYEPYVVPEYSRNYRLADENELYLHSIPYLQFPVLRTDDTGGTQEDRELHADWLAHYLPLVEEGTWAWLEIHRAGLFRDGLPAGVVASAFANRELYLVLANYGEAMAEVATTDEYVVVKGQGVSGGKYWRLSPQSLTILRRAAAGPREPRRKPTWERRLGPEQARSEGERT